MLKADHPHHARVVDRIVARMGNVLQIDFRKPSEPPEPKFPGAGALRDHRCLKPDEARDFWTLSRKPGSLPLPAGAA